MIAITMVDRFTGLKIRPKPPPTPAQVERARRREEEAFDWLAQAAVEGRQD